MLPERHHEIISILSHKSSAKIDELCDKLNVSPATVRRDLSQLEKSGHITRINGGAILSNRRIDGLSHERAEASEVTFLQEKLRIADEAVSLVKEGDTVFIDSGSTNLQIANKLTACSNITVVTNSIEIAYKFVNRKDLSVIICGGTLGEVNPTSIVGPVAEKMITMFRANICFLGASGIHTRQGITDPYLSSARIKEKMIENSMKVVVVSDHSKFGTLNTVFVCDMDKIDQIITDKAAPLDQIRDLRNRGISVALV